MVLGVRCCCGLCCCSWTLWGSPGAACLLLGKALRVRTTCFDFDFDLNRVSMSEQQRCGPSGTYLRRAPVRQKRRKPESGPLEPSNLSPTARLRAAAVPLRALLLGSPFSALLSSAASGAAGSGSADGPPGADVPCNMNRWLERTLLAQFDVNTLSMAWRPSCFRACTLVTGRDCPHTCSCCLREVSTRGAGRGSCAGGVGSGALRKYRCSSAAVALILRAGSSAIMRPSRSSASSLACTNRCRACDCDARD